MASITTDRRSRWGALASLAFVGACATPGAQGPAPPLPVTTPSGAVVTVPLEASAPQPAPAPTEAEPETSTPPGPRPWLGIGMRPADQGVFVDSVFPGSAAESSGLAPGDQLLALAGAKIVQPADVHAALSGHAVGEDVEARIARGGSELRVNVRLGAKPQTAELLRGLFVGKPAPSISSLRTVSGSVVPSFSQLQGKVVVLEFWATWCVACRAMVPVLNQWHDSLGAQGVRVLAVSSEPFEAVSSILPQLGMRYPAFVDESTEVSQAYHAGAVPTLFLVDQQGIVREVEVGFDPRRLGHLDASINALLTPATSP